MRIGFFVSSIIFLFLIPILALADNEIERPIFSIDTYIPKAPEPQSIARNIDIPVNYYAGIPNISIPVYTIKAGNLEIPISLSYHAGGITPSQEATSVGLGWTLNAGGLISRTVKCADDFMEHPCTNSITHTGYMQSTIEWNESYVNNTYFDRYGRLLCDTEADIYYYSLPGIGGKFTYQRDSIHHYPVYINNGDNVKIEYYMGEQGVAFSACDALGNMYYYDLKDRTHVFGLSQNESYKASLISRNSDGFDLSMQIDCNGSSYWNEMQDYTSSWYLTKIVSAEGEEIRFEYEPESYQLPLEDASTKRYNITYNTVHDSGEIKYGATKTLIEGHRLSRIMWNGGCAEFLASPNGTRLDLRSCQKMGVDQAGPMELNEIKIKAQDGSTFMHWKLGHSYFNDETTGNYAHLFKRLRLDSLVNMLDTTESYSFDYYEEYNRKRLPAKNTKNTDYWGFYNGVDQSKDFFCPTLYDGIILKGGNKEPDLGYTKLGTLKGIKWPTGGKTEFEYELNCESDNFSFRPIMQSEEIVVIDDPENVANTRSDTLMLTLPYSQDLSLHITLDYDGAISNPQYQSSTIFTLQDIDRGYTKFLYEVPRSHNWETNSQFSKDTILSVLPAGNYRIIANAPIADMNCRLSLDYCTMGRKQSSGGLRIKSIKGAKDIDYSYAGGLRLISPCYYNIQVYQRISTGQENQDDIKRYLHQSSFSVRPLSTLKDGYTIGYSTVNETFADSTRVEYLYNNSNEEILNEEYPSVPTDFNSLNGTLSKKSVYSSDGTPTSFEETVYSHYGDYEEILGFVSHDLSLIKYNLQIDRMMPTSKIVKEYLDNGILEITQNTEYNGNLLPCKETIISGNDSLVYRTKYVTDFPNDTVYAAMASAHRVGTPIEVSAERNGHRFYGQKIEYGNFGSKYLPKKYLTYNTDNTWDTKVEFLDYDDHANPQELCKAGVNYVYLWGYDGQYPVAEIQNPTFGHFRDWSSYSNIIALLRCDSLDYAVLDSMVRSAEPNGFVTTCRYKPLAGLATITDPTGKMTSYRYDSASRLEKVLFGNKEPLTSYQYHFPEQEDSTSFVRTIVHKEQEASDQNLISSYQYYDKWGREVQTSAQGTNPDGSFTYSYQTYDKVGRPELAWVPIPTGLQESSFIDLEDFSSRSLTYMDDATGYTRSIYDAEGRKIREIMPGRKWQAEARHNKTNYLTNQNDELIRYRISADTLSVDRAGYMTGSLECIETIDADTVRKKTYKDIFGNVVLERRANTNDCYYVYDDFNRLRFVLSPKCHESQGSMDSCRYEYKYDSRGNIIWEKLPGCAPTYYVYDKYGNCILSQNGEQRMQDVWKFMIADKIGRPAMEGICHNRLAYESNPYKDRHVYADYVRSSTGYRGYTLRNIVLSACENQTVNYYDSYNFMSLSGFSSLPSERDAFTDSTIHHGLQTGCMMRVNMPADSTVNVYSCLYYDSHHRVAKTVCSNHKGGYTTTTNRYNYVGDVVHQNTKTSYKKLDNSDWEISQDTENIYDFPNSNLLHSRIRKWKGHSTSIELSDSTTYSYDSQGNLAGMDRTGRYADISYQYDKLHGWLEKIESVPFSQDLLREIGKNARFNGSISAMAWQMHGDSVSRRYDYEYDQLNRLKKASYSEVINTLITRDSLPHDLQPGISLSLVPVANLQANHPSLDIIPLMQQNKYGEKIWYDQNSNITRLQRYGAKNDRQFGLIDDVEITYNGNQRTAATDNVANLTYTGSSEFVKNGAGRYAYNKNGALFRDENRSIDSIEYDLMGNLKKIQFTGNRSIEYVYSAGGEKLREIHKRGPRLLAKNLPVLPHISYICDTTDYIGPLIIRNEHPEMLRFDGGYISFVNDTISGIHYYIQDYMGNNRVVVNGRTDSIEQVTHYYPYGGVIGDISTNESLQPYKFEGKELDRTFGLDNYDIEARQYFAMAPMWDRPDKLAHKYYGISPYVFCGGDPVNFGDYDGMKPDSLEAALMANHVYDGTGPLEGGWSCDHRVSHRNGLKYGIYSRLNPKTNKKEYSLVFAGSEDWTDWKTDIIQDLFNAANPLSQFSDAVTTTSLLKHERASGLEITNIGHSLGGALAQVATLKSGDAAITFNPAGVSKETLKGLNLDYTGQDITNYVARGDDNWGNHGEFAGALYSERTARMGETIYLNNISKNSTIISRHYISYIINALSKGRIIIK